jgi:hypothetical protein
MMSELQQLLDKYAADERFVTNRELLRIARLSGAEIEQLQVMTDRLRQKLYDAQRERDEARAAARWLRIVLTNQTQGEFMAGVYEHWPWLKLGGDDDHDD